MPVFLFYWVLSCPYQSKVIYLNSLLKTLKRVMLFQQRWRMPWYTFFNVFTCLGPSCRSGHSLSWIVIPVPSALTFLSYPLPSSVSLDWFLQMTSAELKTQRQLVLSNVRKNIFSKMKRILMRSISSTVYIIISKDTIDFVRLPMLSSEWSKSCNWQSI